MAPVRPREQISLRCRCKRLSGLNMGRKHTYATKAQLETLARRMHRTGILYYEALGEFRRQFILVVLRDVNWNHRMSIFDAAALAVSCLKQRSTTAAIAFFSRDYLEPSKENGRTARTSNPSTRLDEFTDTCSAKANG